MVFWEKLAFGGSISLLSQEMPGLAIHLLVHGGPGGKLAGFSLFSALARETVLYLRLKTSIPVGNSELKALPALNLGYLKD